MICIIVAICDINLTPPQSIRYPQFKTFFANIHLLQFITTPKLGISGELPTPLSIRPPNTIREGWVPLFTPKKSEKQKSVPVNSLELANRENIISNEMFYKKDNFHVLFQNCRRILLLFTKEIVLNTFYIGEGKNPTAKINALQNVPTKIRYVR